MRPVSRIRRAIPFLLLPFLSIPLSAQVTTDRPRVTVLPVVNATGLTQYESVALTVTDTIRLTLELLGSYEVVVAEEETVSPELTFEDVEALSEFLHVDDVVFGEVRLGSEGEIVFDMSLFDRAEGEIVLRDEWMAEGVLDVFATTDRLVQEFVSNFSGVRIGFGSIRFVPSRTNADYRVFVDGVHAGDNIEELERVLIGDRSVLVRQVSIGGETTILEEQLFVEEGGTLSLELELPEVTRADVEYVAARRTVIDEHLPQPYDLEGVASAVAQLDAFFSEAPDALPDQRSRHGYDYLRLELARDFYRIIQFPYLENGRFSLTDGDADELLGLSGQVLQEQEYRSDEARMVREEASRNVAAMYEMCRLSAAYLLSAEQYDRFYEPYNGVRLIVSRTTLPYRYPGEVGRSRSASERYHRLDRRRKPMWHWLAAGLGVAAAGTGGYIYVTDPISPLLNEANELEEEYDAATDVEELLTLRSEIEGNYDEANTLETVQWAGLGAGTGLLATAVVSRILTLGRPERKTERFARENYPVEMAAAEGVFVEEYGPGEAGLLVFNRGKTVSEETTIHATPWYSRRAAGEEITLTGGQLLSLPRLHPRKNQPVRFTLQEGLNVVVLE
ncbi:MAG: hypothetical protein ACLFPP_11800 [Spirochaetaceae bacterium]